MESFGSLLKVERIKRGVSLDEVSAVTKISVHVLEALESDRIEGLPAIPFVKGFIHNYAKYLELEPKEYVHRYLEFISRHQISERKIIFEGEGQENVKVSFDQNKILVRVRGINKKRIFLFSLIIVIILGCWLLVSFIIRHASAPEVHTPPVALQIPPLSRPLSQSTAESHQDTPSAQIQPSPPEIQQAGEAQTMPQQKIADITEGELIIKALYTTWIDIGIDDKPHYDTLLKPGEVLNLKAKESFSLWIGNAGGIEISLNGKPLEPPGRRGEVTRLRLSAVSQ